MSSSTKVPGRAENSIFFVTFLGESVFPSTKDFFIWATCKNVYFYWRQHKTQLARFDIFDGCTLNRFLANAVYKYNYEIAVFLRIQTHQRRKHREQTRTAPKKSFRVYCDEWFFSVEANLVFAMHICRYSLENVLKAVHVVLAAKYARFLMRPTAPADFHSYGE